MDLHIEELERGRFILATNSLYLRFSVERSRTLALALSPLKLMRSFLVVHFAVYRFRALLRAEMTDLSSGDHQGTVRLGQLGETIWEWFDLQH